MEIEHNHRTAATAIGNRQQSFACTKCEVIMGARIIAKVDLCRQRSVAWGFDEEMDMRRAITMATKRLHQTFRGATRRTTISARHF